MCNYETQTKKFHEVSGQTVKVKPFMLFDIDLASLINPIFLNDMMNHETD